ncbi:hypothetical protein, partial [Burkholderia vietnamiensis]|uniref:hypothetical protein n=1 Tax=Burkholderia vietnamiensis TaxID=60552 RepID=UPI001E4ED57C
TCRPARSRRRCPSDSVAFHTKRHGASELNPNVTIDATVLPYSESRRLLIVHLRPKNVGKVPVDLSDGEMWVKVRQIPDKIGDGPINFDKLPVTFQKTDMLQRYKGGYEIDPGVEFDEIATFVVQPGKYHVEGEAGWPDGDDVGDQTVVNVQ